MQSVDCFRDLNNNLKNPKRSFENGSKALRSSAGSKMFLKTRWLKTQCSNHTVAITQQHETHVRSWRVPRQVDSFLLEYVTNMYQDHMIHSEAPGRRAFVPINFMQIRSVDNPLKHSAFDYKVRNCIFYSAHILQSWVQCVKKDSPSCSSTRRRLHSVWRSRAIAEQIHALHASARTCGDRVRIDKQQREEPGDEGMLDGDRWEEEHARANKAVWVKPCQWHAAFVFHVVNKRTAESRLKQIYSDCMKKPL